MSQQQKAMQLLLQKKKAAQKQVKPASSGSGKARGSQVMQVKKQFTRRSGS